MEYTLGMLKKASKKYLIIEFIILFILVPILLVLPIASVFKIFPVVSGFVYLLFILYQYTGFKINIPSKKNFISFLRFFIPRLVPVLVLGYLYIYLTNPDELFGVIMNDPGLWVTILFVYSFVSVLPQELIYRTFFFHRYTQLVKNKYFFIFLNAFVFSISHMFLRSWFVLLITFFGGIMFALTYKKTQSTWLVSLEHAVYGLWLFTVGIGQTLAFPG